MKTRTAAVAVLFFASAALADDAWFELKDFGPVTQRVAVTVENPADVPVEAAVVHVPLKELQQKLPDAKEGQVCVVDPETKPAPRAAADLNFVPAQVSADTLIFAVPLKAHEKRQVYVYTAPQPLNMPGFTPKTAWDNRHAYRSFENNLIAYRMETGPGANTMGFGIDAFGKTAKGKGMRLMEAYEAGHDSYHKLSFWGVDILKVGYGPAIGGLYVVSGDQMGRPQFATSYVDCVYTGPVETAIDCWAPIEVAGKKVTLKRRLTLVGDDRTIHDAVRVEGDNVDGLQIGIGIRDLPNGKWSENKELGYAMSAGDTNQPNSGYDSVAIGAVLPKSGFEKVVPISDPKGKPGFGDGGHIYVLKAEKDGNAVVAQNRLTMIWNGDGEINNPADFEKALTRWAAQRDNPVKVSVGEKAEAKK
jgi:hypothetical protein